MPAIPIRTLRGYRSSSFSPLLIPPRLLPSRALPLVRLKHDPNMILQRIHHAEGKSEIGSGPACVVAQLEAGTAFDQELQERDMAPS